MCPYLSNGLSVHWGATEKVACFADSEGYHRLGRGHLKVVWARLFGQCGY